MTETIRQTETLFSFSSIFYKKESNLFLYFIYFLSLFFHFSYLFFFVMYSVIFFFSFVCFVSLTLLQFFTSLHFFFFLYHLSDLFLSATDLAAKGPVSEDTQAHHKVTDRGSHILEVNNYHHDISNFYRNISFYNCLVAF